MSAKLIGGPDLRARLASLADVPASFAGEWADTAAQTMRDTHPPAQRPESERFTTKASATRGAVYGAFWWIFVDRGTKAHEELPHKSVMTWNGGSGTIFAKRVHHPRTRRQPFITKAAQDALYGTDFAAEIVHAWNFRRLRGHKAFL